MNQVTRARSLTNQKIHIPPDLLPANTAPTGSENTNFDNNTNSHIARKEKFKSQEDILATIEKQNTIISSFIAMQAGHIESQSIRTKSSIHVVHNRYNELVAEVQSAIFKNQLAAKIDLDNFTDLIKFIDEKLGEAERVDFHEKSNIDIVRLKTTFKRFLKSSQTQINDTIERIKGTNNSSNRDSQDVKFDHFYAKPIYQTVFEPQYFELPMVAFAFFIDFMMILVLFLMNSIRKIEARQL